MAKVYADKRFVGTWKCTTIIKDTLFNDIKLKFPEKVTKIISVSNTQGGTIMYFGQPSPEAKGIPATRASGIAVEFLFRGKNDRYIVNELIKINIVENSHLIGESVLEYEVPKKGVVAKLVTRSDYRRIGRMRS